MGQSTRPSEPPTRPVRGRRYLVDAARIPRVATEESAGGQPEAARGAMPTESLVAVVRARGIKAAPRPQPQAQGRLVDPDQAHEHVFHRGVRVRSAERKAVNAWSRSAAKPARLAVAAVGAARTTNNAPAGTALSRSRMRCRSRRRTRLRTTAGPTERATTKPTRRSSRGLSSTCRCRTTQPRPARRPRRTANANSLR